MRYLTITLICAVSICPMVRADDAFTRNSVPQKWIEPVLPEDLPDLDYPAYYNTLEKAKLEAFSGRYKKSLYTLMSVSDGDPIEVALVKGTSLAAIGKRDEALAALSATPQIAADPRVQIKRANILAELGRTDEAISLLKEHLSLHPNSIAGHYWLGWMYEKIGDLDAARNTYGWFVTAPQDFLERGCHAHGPGDRPLGQPHGLLPKPSSIARHDSGHIRARL
jgi:Flp pilus assembly protein TadD